LVRICALRPPGRGAGCFFMALSKAIPIAFVEGLA
jgi:hypothetical protein